MMRSLLISSVTPKILANAHLYEADYLIFDLDRTIPIEEKDSARELLVQAVKHMDYNLDKIIVNINLISSEYWKKDIEDLFHVGIRNFGINLKDQNNIKLIDKFFKNLEEKNNVEEGSCKIMYSIGSPLLIMNIQNIIMSTTRIKAISFNADEFRKNIKVEKNKSNEDLSLSKRMLVMGSALKNIYCIDSPFEDLSDEDNFIREIKDNMNIGFNGKICFHPSQVRIINNIYKSSYYYKD
ncbi:HpcH/HpaI aldolase/citrate lyase family protein [Fusobacterium sp. MFO224]|uniref:HpcH/HpaI aldolase/citrate lyase family protein n=1 Tax=Fusobacterium sp. MFO224 TaxID=3378070 RepID=UPI003853687E